MTPRRIVVATYYFPPSTAVGGARWDAMARHLRAAGHQVTVITSVAHGSRPDDRGEGVIRTSDLVASSGLRRLLGRGDLPQPGAAASITPAPAALTSVIVPDSYLMSWVPSAARAVRRRVRAGLVDCVITTGPPDSTHLIGLALCRGRPAWIADFRDGWTFEPLREPWPTAPQRVADAWLERRVVRDAEAVIGAVRPIADDLRRRFGARAHWIPNGWDPQWAASVRGSAPPAGIEEQDGWALLVHTGTLSGPRGRDPRPLLRALRAVNEAARPNERRVRLVLAGRRTVEDDRLLEEAGLAESVQHVGLLDRATAVALQRKADALLLLTGTHTCEATGKLFEYLSAGRPILALAEANEAARIVTSTGTGVAIPITDGPRVEEALRAVARGELDASYQPHGLEPFVYPGPARAVAELVEEAIAMRAGSTRPA